MKSLSCVRLFATPWTEAYQAPPSMGFSRQEYWSGVPIPSPFYKVTIGKTEIRSRWQLSRPWWPSPQPVLSSLQESGRTRWLLDLATRSTHSSSQLWVTCSGRFGNGPRAAEVGQYQLRLSRPAWDSAHQTGLSTGQWL